MDGGAGTCSGGKMGFVDIDRTSVTIRPGEIRHCCQFKVVTPLLHAATAVASAVAAEAAIRNPIIRNLGPSCSSIGRSPDAVVGFAGGLTNVKHPHIHLVASGCYGELRSIDRAGR